MGSGGGYGIGEIIREPLSFHSKLNLLMAFFPPRKRYNKISRSSQSSKIKGQDTIDLL